MNRGIFIFVGILAILALSFWALIFIPQTQIGQQRSRFLEDTGEFYPAARSGLARKGADVYRAEGCVECHSQQVRAASLGTDIERGWGPRFTVAQDYVGDHPVLLGTQRIGPDLANVSTRRDMDWHLRHLYEPRSVAPGSLMPPYRYLFEKRRIAPGKGPSENALKSIDNVPSGYEIVPSESAQALVAYLLSLTAPVNLFEAPVRRKPGLETNAAPAQATTNATNAASSAAPPTSTPVSVK